MNFIFHDFPGLENEIIILHDFPGFPGTERTNLVTEQNNILRHNHKAASLTTNEMRFPGDLTVLNQGRVHLTSVNGSQSVL